MQAGCGKSSLIANFINSTALLRDDVSGNGHGAVRQQPCVFHHMAEASPDARCVTTMLLRFLAHACERFGADTAVPGTYAQLEGAVQRVLTQLGAQRKLVLIVDGADHFDTEPVTTTYHQRTTTIHQLATNSDN